MIQDPNNSYVYHPEGRLCAVKNALAGTATQYVYDADGNRKRFSLFGVCTMKRQAKGILILLLAIAMICSAQSPANDRSGAQETQVREYWVDPSTGLMWAGKDNGKAVSWKDAAKYCHNLRLAGYSDWRLATLDELASLVDKSGPTPQRTGNAETLNINLGHHVRGNLSLTGNPWSSTREINRFGHPYGDGWFYDFVNSKPSGDLPYLHNTKYALCVRRPGQ